MRIVIIRPAPLGDSLIAFLVIRALREKYTDVHIAFVGNPIVLPLAQAWGIAEEVYDYNHYKLDELNAAEGIRSANWLQLLQKTDLAVYWYVFNDRYMERNLLSAGAREVLLADGLPHNTTKPLVEHLAESVGIRKTRAEFTAPITTSDNEFCLYDPPIAIHTGSSNDYNLWPAASFATVINRLMQLQQPVLVTVGPFDTEQVREVRQHLSLPPRPGLLTFLRNAPLLEVARRIKQCRCYLGNDTGITHLAAMLGVPTIALFHPRFVGQMQPLGPVVEVIQEDPMQRITVERVFVSVQRYL